jgi:hypothetical protein
MFPTYLFFRDNISLIFSGGRYDLIIETIKIITNRRIRILIESKIKKLNALAINVSEANSKIKFVNQTANNCIG